MQETTSREKILKKIRNALMSKLENPYQDTSFDDSIYEVSEESLDITFAQEFTKASGKFIYCSNDEEFFQNLQILIKENQWEELFCNEEFILQSIKTEGIDILHSFDELTHCKIGLSSCEALIARLGSILVSSKQSAGRKMNAFPEVHIVYAYTSQLVSDIKDGLKFIQNKYANDLPSMTTVITGPSRTADIEKTLVKGAHGPKELYLFFIDDSIN
jgi:L-lactate dehydrogenase complex protein LldG